MKQSLLGFLFFSLPVFMFSQGVLVGPESGTPDPAAILETRSTSQGLLPPRLTTVQRDAIENPPAGLRIYNTDTGCENYYSGTSQHWMSICGSCAPFPPSPVTANSSSYEIQWSWSPVADATGYRWNTINDYYSATDLGPATSLTQYNTFGEGVEHVMYIWSYNEQCGESERPGRHTATPCFSNLQPSDSGPILSSNQIMWRWSGSALGYKINTVNDYNSATDIGLTTSYLQSGLTADTEYTLYIWGYDPNGENCYSEAAALTASTTSGSCTIGATGPGGGYIIYCGSAYPGKTGIEVTAADVSSGAPWGCSGTIISGGDGYAYGTGNQNTTDIMNGCGTAGIAARLCGDLSENGYSDWFLPSQQELQDGLWNIRTINPTALDGAGFTNSLYWTSTENGSSDAYRVKMPEGYGTAGPMGSPIKSNNYRVRCARAF